MCCSCVVLLCSTNERALTVWLCTIVTSSGLLTAGLLWTPLHDDTSFVDNVDNLITQIMANKIKPDEAEDEQANNDPNLFSMQDIRGEIERMKGDMMPEDAASDQQIRGDDTMAAIPSLAPQLPRGILVTKEMEELQDQLTSTASVRVGFCGMGGIVSTH